MESIKVIEKELDSDTKSFYQFHGVQLIGINFPPEAKFITQLYKKLKTQVFDSGNYFEILENQDLDRFE